MSVKPFQWTNLKKVSGEEIRLADALLNFIPQTSARENLSRELLRMLMKHLGEKSFYYVDSVTTCMYGEFLARLPDCATLAVVGTEPAGHKIVAHLDNNMVHLLIDRLLGGSGDVASENRPLSETEAGVIQYLIMQVMATVWKVFGEAGRYHFRFDKFVFNASDASTLLSAKEPAVVIAFRVGIGELSGFVKLLFPKQFIEKVALDQMPPQKGAEYDYFVQKTRAYDFIRTILWAEAGRAAVPANDIALLEEGDVLLFDDTGLELKDGNPAGRVDLKVGYGEEGSFKAAIFAQAKNIKCTIVGG